MTTRLAAPLFAVAALAAAAPTALALPAGWNAPARISPSGVAAYEPAAAANAVGDLAVAWRARRAGHEVVQVRTRRAGASAWGAPIAIGLRVDSVQGVRVTVAADGQVLVGWQTKAGRASMARAAIIAADGSLIRRWNWGPAKGASGPVSVAFGTTGVAVATWIAPGPSSVNATSRRLGRAMVAVAKRGKNFGPARLLDPSKRPGEGAGANDSGAAAVAGLDGRVLVSWDEDDDIRDFVTHVATVGANGSVGRQESAKTLSRGSTQAALADTGGGGVFGLITEGNDFDSGNQLRRIARSGSGAWTQAQVPVAGVSPDEFELPYVHGAPVLARNAGGTILGAFLGAENEPWGLFGDPVATPFPSAVQLGPKGEFTALAGAGLTTAGTGLVVWSQRTAPASQERTVHAVTRLATDLSFPAPVEALRIPILVGSPVLALGAGGRGALVYSQGPKATATVRVITLSVP